MAKVQESDLILLDEVHAATVQAMLHAIWDIPGEMEKVDAYMRGCGIDNPQEEISDIAALLF